MSEKVLPKPASSYVAHRNGVMVVSGEEALMVWIPYRLLNSEVEYSGKHSVCIMAKDGTVQAKNVATLKKVFPQWESADPFDLELIELTEEGTADFELADCYHDNSYIPQGESEPIIQFKARWLNPIGGTMNMPTPMSDGMKKDVRSKVLSKFKAILGGTPAKSTKPEAAATAKKEEPAPAKPEAKKPVAAPAPKAPVSKGPPSRNHSSVVARTSTMDEAWAAFEKANSEISDEEKTAKWWADLATHFPDIKQDANFDMTPTQWGQFLNHLGL